jgi:hypothetical protein
VASAGANTIDSQYNVVVKYTLDDYDIMAFNQNFNGEKYLDFYFRNHTVFLTIS